MLLHSDGRSKFPNVSIVNFARVRASGQQPFPSGKPFTRQKKTTSTEIYFQVVVVS